MHSQTNKTKLGVMGGSFDPIHNAHLALALAAFKQADLEKIVFVPARQAPLRTSQNTFSAQERLEMLKLALKKFPAPSLVECFELQREQISYSCDTAKFLKEKYPKAEIAWIIGDDHLKKLKSWHNIDRLCDEISFICASRNSDLPQLIANSKEPNKELAEKLAKMNLPPNAKIKFIEFAKMPHSSTEVRKLLLDYFGESAEAKKLAEEKLNSLLDLDVFEFIKRIRKKPNA